MAAQNIFFVHRFLSSLVFTDVIETAVLVFLLWFVFRNRSLGLWRMVAAGFFASFSTISYVWFVFPYLIAWPSQGALLLSAETFAFVVEALFYRLALRLDWKIAFAVSLICNVVSYFLGPILRAHGIWYVW